MTNPPVAAQTEPDESWMIRPCEMYKEEYSDCTSMKGRFHQYFVFGETIDCSQWKRDFDNCVRWTTDDNTKAYREVVQSEKQRRIERLRGHYKNDVWEKRSEPPDDWQKPLPEWMQKEHKNSFLELKALQMKGENVHSLCWSTCTGTHSLQSHARVSGNDFGHIWGKKGLIHHLF